MAEQQFYGWYDDANQRPDQPTHNPPFDGPCLWCGSAIDPENDVRTYSISPVEGYARRSYFYRIHRTCDDRHTPASMDDFIFGMIERNGD